MAKNIEVIAFRKCLNERCVNYGGMWPAVIEECPMPECGMTGYPIGIVAKDHDAEPEPVEEPGD